MNRDTATTAEEIGVSDWVLVDQALIDRFADATMDRQFIHVDPQRAAASPFGTTIAHGLLSLSLLPHLIANVRIVEEDYELMVNYGFDRVRFVSPVPSGSELRAVSVCWRAANANPARPSASWA